MCTPPPQASKWTSDDLYRHAAFCEEWLFRVAAPEPYPLGARLEVVDLKGMRFTDIGSGWFSWWVRQTRDSFAILFSVLGWKRGEVQCGRPKAPSCPAQLHGNLSTGHACLSCMSLLLCKFQGLEQPSRRGSLLSNMQRLTLGSRSTVG